MTTKEQSDEYYKFYLDMGLTPYESKRCAIHLVNELIKFGKSNAVDLSKIEYLNKVKYHLTQI